MHAQDIVQRFIQLHLSAMHAARRKVLVLAVGAIVGGHFLSLTRIARAMSGRVRVKVELTRFRGRFRTWRVGPQ